MKNLKNLRHNKHLSQQALADKLNLSQQSIYKYENDLVEPSLGTLKDIASFFDVSIDYLIGYSDCPHKIEEVTETWLNEEELTLIRKYRLLPASTRTILQAGIDDILQYR